MVDPSRPELKGQVSFECGSWDGPLETSFVGAHEAFWCSHPNAGLIWDMTADVSIELDDDGSLQDLAVIHPLLALKITKQDDRRPTKPSEGNSPSNCMKRGTCLASSCGMEGHMCGNGHCLKTMSEPHRQLAKLLED